MSASLFVLSNNPATDVFRKTNPNQLKILTWNIYMLPHCSLIHGNCKRARLIAQQLSFSDYDIIVFQEAFDNKARGILRRKLQRLFPYMYGPTNRSVLSVRTSSGLWVISRIPLGKVDEIEYAHRFGIDAMARKGAVLFSGEWNGQEFQLAGTHLQADSPDEFRRAQCREMAERLLDKHAKKDVPQIVCGDFNIGQDDPWNYNYMLHTLTAENGAIEGDIHTSFDETGNALAKKAHGKQQLIDYVLVRHGQFFSSVKRRIAVRRAFGRNAYQELSDHYGVEAILEFSGYTAQSAEISLAMYQ